MKKNNEKNNISDENKYGSENSNSAEEEEQ
jgi:hypothetical protein